MRGEKHTDRVARRALSCRRLARRHAPMPVEALRGSPEGFLPKVRIRRSGAACKPGSVSTPGCPGAGEGHSSRPTIAGRLEHSHPDTAPGPKSRRLSGPLSTMSLFELAPGGACLAAGHPAVARGLLPHDFTLTCAEASGESWAIGGVFSAALSLGSPRVAVNDLPVLWSPDFPPVNAERSPATFRPPSAGGRIVSRGRPAVACPAFEMTDVHWQS